MFHIAWLGKKSPFCGNVSYGNTTTQQLKKRGHKVSFVHFDNSTNKDFKSYSFTENYQEVNLPYLIKSQIYTIPSLRAERVLKESLKKLKPDIVHASLTLSPLDFRLPKLCKELKVPLVATFHPAFDSKMISLTASAQQVTYQIYARSLAKYDKVIVFSDVQKELLKEFGIHENKLIIIPNGVDQNIWKPLTSPCNVHKNIKQKIGLDRIFLYMGRIVTEKNVVALIKAWKQIKKTNCKLLIVGDGPKKTTLENNFFDTTQDDIIWWGEEVDLKTRIAIMQLSEVFILPSLIEGLSIGLLEAMSTGVACVATDAGADGEVLENGAGIIISTDKVSTQLKTIIPILLDQPSLTKTLGAKARERIIERYTIEQNIDKIEKVYCELKSSKTN